MLWCVLYFCYCLSAHTTSFNHWQFEELYLGSHIWAPSSVGDFIMCSSKIRWYSCISILSFFENQLQRQLFRIASFASRCSSSGFFPFVCATLFMLTHHLTHQFLYSYIGPTLSLFWIPPLPLHLPWCRSRGVCLLLAGLEFASVFALAVYSRVCCCTLCLPWPCSRSNSTNTSPSAPGTLPNIWKVLSLYNAVVSHAKW